MRVLGIETSSRRGSVALVEDGTVVSRATHEELNAHAERLASMIDDALAAAGWTKASLHRLGVGMGPGSFTGVRVGIAFAQGIALGLGIPLIGVGSLEAMARAARPHDGPTVALLDARRGEVFAAAYAADGSELLAPCALPRERALAELEGRLGRGLRFLGEVARALGAPAPPPPLGAERLGYDWANASELPDAIGAALLATERSPSDSLDEPAYVRDAGATPQSLPPSPFGD